MDINYAVLLPPPKRSAKKLQMAILGGVGFVALAAIVVAIVLMKAYAPQAAPLGPQVPTPAVAASQPVVAPAPVATADPKTAPAAVDKDDKSAKAKKRPGRGGKRVKPAAAASPSGSTPAARPKKKGDDELKKLLGI